MPESAPEQVSYREYHKFYLARNPEDAGRFERHARDYQRKFGALVLGGGKTRVLDVGCASGMLAGWLVRAGVPEVIGIDLNPELVEMARQRVPGAQFHAGDAAEFLRGGRPFDIIFLQDVIEHIPREKIVGFMRALAQALTPGGFALVRTPNMNHLMAAGHLADDLTHCTGLTEQSLRQLAELAGFGRVLQLDQFAMQNFKGKLKVLLGGPMHHFLWWLRGGTRPRVIYRNLYAQLIK